MGSNCRPSDFMSKKPLRLGNLQLQILRALWDAGPCTVTDVVERLPKGHGLAYTTIATMLRKMEARGLVEHEVEGRRFIYRAAVPAEEVTQSMAGDLLDRLFEGSLADMVSHLLSTREVSRDELGRIESLIAARKKRS
jgi:predicted transcriptional regulator